MEDFLSWLLDEINNEIEETGATSRLVRMREAVEAYLMEHKEVKPRR